MENNKKVQRQIAYGIERCLNPPRRATVLLLGVLPLLLLSGLLLHLPLDKFL
jgi:hypothetical protein